VSIYGGKKMAELKPCPFCGSEAKMIKLYDDYYIKCGNYCCEQSIAYEDIEMAIEAWNRRAEDDK
jgi:Lar family restriction alleviation protein